MAHFINKCSCGIVIGQCRCPSPNKTVNVITNGCEACQAKEQTNLGVPKKDQPKALQFEKIIVS